MIALGVQIKRTTITWTVELFMYHLEVLKKRKNKPSWERHLQGYRLIPDEELRGVKVQRRMNSFLPPKTKFHQAEGNTLNQPKSTHPETILLNQILLLLVRT